MTNINYPFINQGWQCPVCHRVYSPSTSMCLYCPVNRYHLMKSNGSEIIKDNNTDLNQPKNGPQNDNSETFYCFDCSPALVINRYFQDKVEAERHKNETGHKNVLRSSKIIDNS